MRKTWEQMKGFQGEPGGNYFAGLVNIHVLTTTSGDKQELRFELRGHGQGRYLEAYYDSFEIGDEGDKFRLSAGSFLGVSMYCTSHMCVEQSAGFASFSPYTLYTYV